MADETNGDDSEMFDISKLSEAERRRLRRRQRILDNQGARLKRILTSDPEVLKEENVKVKTDSNKSGETKPPSDSHKQSKPTLSTRIDTGDVGADEISMGGILETPVSDDSPVTVHFRKHMASANSSKEQEATLNTPQELSGSGTGTQDTPREQVTRIGVQSDGTVILPKISIFYGRFLICLLAIFLSVCNAKRYLITFISWEVAYYFINGLPPLPPPDMVMVVAAIVGLKESQLLRVKKILHFTNCVLIDFSLFLVFTLLPHFIRHLMSF